MRTFYIKTISVLFLSFLLTIIATKFAFFEEMPVLRPSFNKLVEKAVTPFYGSKGDPVMVGVDPTPPPQITR